ncbi:MAG: sugar 3,4-ketoisomerase [Roseiarcus sp.]
MRIEYGSGRSGILDLPVVPEARGNLTFIESGQHVPFEIRRVYYLYDVPSGASRGGHAHRNLEQLLIAVSGSFDVAVDNGSVKKRYTLNRSHFGLYIGPFNWREIDNFSSNSVCLVLASMHFDESDYFRDYDAFIRSLGGGR